MIGAIRRLSYGNLTTGKNTIMLLYTMSHGHTFQVLAQEHHFQMIILKSFLELG